MKQHVKVFLSSVFVSLWAVVGLPACDYESEVPEMCGDDGPGCPEGYACFMEGGEPGHCITHAAATGMACGGCFGPPCAEGYVCVYSEWVRRYSQMGHCEIGQ